MKKAKQSNPLKTFNDNYDNKVKKVTEGNKKLVKAQTGGGSLTKAELDALAHQKRGMGTFLQHSFVKEAGPVKNKLGTLTDNQVNQLNDYMNKRSTLEKIYEGLPNIGRMWGSSAADITKNSQLQNQKKGGQTKSKKK